MRLVRAPRVFASRVIRCGESLELPAPIRGPVAIDVRVVRWEGEPSGSCAPFIVFNGPVHRMPVVTIGPGVVRSSWAYIANDVPVTGFAFRGDADVTMRVDVYAMEARVEDIPVGAVRAYRVLPTAPRDVIVERVYEFDHPGSGDWIAIAHVPPSFLVGTNIVSRKLFACEECPGNVRLARQAYELGAGAPPDVPLRAGDMRFEVGFAWHTILARRAGHYRVRVIYAMDVWPMEVVA